MEEEMTEQALPAAPQPEAPETVTSYKGFDAKWKCRSFQYAVGETYRHEGEVAACNAGFHACEHPLDVFSYYPPAGSRFAIVEQSGDLSRHSGDTKIASRSITIKAEIDLPGLIRAAIEYTFKRANPVDPDSPASATGRYGAASATAPYGAASATAPYGAASATGLYGAASATAPYGAASATAYQGAASATGRYGAASATGPYGVAVSAYNGRAMAGETGAIVLVRRNDDGEIVHIRASKVGENGIKAGVWYSLDAGGQFVEVEA